MAYLKYFLALVLVSFSWAWNKHMENRGLYQGDIILTPDELDRLHKVGSNAFGSIRTKRWTNGVIPYEINSNMGPKGVEFITAAMKDYMDNTCLKFVKRTTQRNYVHFYKGTGCNSFVGMIGGKQIINLEYPGCYHKSTALHEIGHALGLHHEQNRPDRDQFVTIHFNNLYDQKWAYAFYKKSTNEVDSLGTPYDFWSMMHYGSYAFGKSNMRTITTKDTSKQSIIDNNYYYGLSKIDIQQVNLMYCKGSTGGGSGDKIIPCWSKCFGKTGFCPSACGQGKACCRRGWSDKGTFGECSNADIPCNSGHCCSTIKPSTDTTNCWVPCQGKTGYCASFCGAGKACCRKNWSDKGPNNECNNAIIPCDHYHCCSSITNA